MTIRDEIRAALLYPLSMDQIIGLRPSTADHRRIDYISALEELADMGKIRCIKGDGGKLSYQIADWPVDADKVDAPAERAPAVIVTDGCVVVRLADGGIVLAQRKVKFSESTEIAPGIVRAICELAKAAP